MGSKCFSCRMQLCFMFTISLGSMIAILVTFVATQDGEMHFHRTLRATTCIYRGFELQTEEVTANAVPKYSVLVFVLCPDIFGPSEPLVISPARRNLEPSAYYTSAEIVEWALVSLPKRFNDSIVVFYSSDIGKHGVSDLVNTLTLDPRFTSTYSNGFIAAQVLFGLSFIVQLTGFLGAYLFNVSLPGGKKKDDARRLGALWDDIGKPTPQEQEQEDDGDAEASQNSTSTAENTDSSGQQ